jgi:hypothetical protein
MDCIQNVTRRGDCISYRRRHRCVVRVVPLGNARTQIGLEAGRCKVRQNFKRALKQVQVVYPEANMVPAGPPSVFLVVFVVKSAA